MGGVKSAYALKKQVKALQKEIAERESKEAFYRLDILNRTTEFLNQTQVIFGLVDYMLDPKKNKRVATIGEARIQWSEFKSIVDKGGSHQEILDEVGVDILVTRSDNERIVIDGWNKSRSGNNE